MKDNVQHKIGVLIEESIEKSIVYSITVDQLKKTLPKKYHKLLDNFIEYSKSQYDRTGMGIIKEFYMNHHDNTNTIFDYIPLGWNNAEYLVYDTVSKKIIGFYHDENYKSGKRGENIKGDPEEWAEHLIQSAELTKKHYEEGIESVEKRLSTHLGFKIELDPLEFKGIPTQSNSIKHYVGVYANKEKDSYDNFGSKSFYDKLKKFK